MHKNIITVRSYVWGSDDDWEGICTTFDIAAQGTSLKEVNSLLRDAVEGYLEELSDLSPKERKLLLNRKSPLRLRILLHTQYLLSRMKRIVKITTQIDSHLYNPVRIS